MCAPPDAERRPAMEPDGAHRIGLAATIDTEFTPGVGASSCPVACSTPATACPWRCPTEVAS